ncbi:MAG: hypothetical protein ACKO3T_03820 [Planctomycetaceae bacterium]
MFLFASDFCGSNFSTRYLGDVFLNQGTRKCFCFFPNRVDLAGCSVTPRLKQPLVHLLAGLVKLNLPSGKIVLELATQVTTESHQDGFPLPGVLDEQDFLSELRGLCNSISGVLQGFDNELSEWLLREGFRQIWWSNAGPVQFAQITQSLIQLFLLTREQSAGS